MSAPQDAFVRKAIRLLEAGGEQSAQRALSMVETIPEPARWFMEFTVLLEMELLRKLGREDDRKRTLLRFLVHAECNEAWADYGMELLPWIESLEETEAIDGVLTTLRDVCARHPFAPPRLLLAEALIPPTPPVEEAVALFREAIERPRWRSLSAAPYWMGLLARAAFWVDMSHTTRGRSEEALRSARAVASFPWRSAKAFQPSDLRLLCSVFFDNGLDRELHGVCNHYRRTSDWRVPRYWLGRSAWRARNFDAACAHYLAAVAGDELDDYELGVVATSFIERERFADARRTLERIADKDDSDFIFADAQCLQGEERWEEALARWDCLLERMPGDTGIRAERVRSLMELDRADELEASLRELTADPESEQHLFACLQLACILTDGGRAEEGMELLQPFLLPEALAEFDAGFRPFVEDLAGDAFAALGDDEEAAAWYERSLSGCREPRTMLSYTQALVRLGRYQEAGAALSQARRSGLEEHGAWAVAEAVYVDLLLSAEASRWQDTVRAYRALALDWLRENDRVAAALAPTVRALVELDRPIDALEVCEDAPTDIVEDGTLRELRRAALRRLRAQSKAARSNAEEQRKRLEESERLRRIVEERSARDRAAVRASRKHTRRFQKAQAETAAATAAVDLPRWIEDLERRVRAQLRSAELIWSQLAAQSDADHGPIVVQLGRVVEGEMNRVVVDGLVRIHFEAGGRLDTFPVTGDWHLKEQGNRLSLGQLADILTTRIERREHDGSVTLIRKTWGDGRHEQLLERLLGVAREGGLTEERIDDFRNRLPLMLADIARIRNQAGHAGRIITRSEAKRVREMVLGTRPDDGVLGRLRLIQQAISRE